MEVIFVSLFGEFIESFAIFKWSNVIFNKLGEPYVIFIHSPYVEWVGYNSLPT